MATSYLDDEGQFEVTHLATHAEREGFRISEISLSETQQVPWHYHSRISDTFYVLEGEITVYAREPKEKYTLKGSETTTIKPGRPHLVRNTGEGLATFLVLQGLGEYDYIPYPDK